MEERILKPFLQRNSKTSNIPCYKLMRQSSVNRTIIKTRKLAISLVLLTIIIILPTSVHTKLTITKECGELVCKPHNYCSQVDHSCRPCQVACDPVLRNYDQGVCEKDCQDYLHDLWYMRKPENESEFRNEEYIDLFYNVQQDLKLLKILIGVVIILSTVVTLALFAIMIYFKRLRNRLHQQSTTDSPYLKQSKKFADYPVIYSNSKVLSLPLQDINKGPPSHVSSSLNNNLSQGSSPDLVSRTVTTQASSYNNSFFPASTYTLSSKNKDNTLGLRGGGGGFVMENPAVKTPSLKEKQSRLRKEPSESTLPEYHAYDNPTMETSPVHIHM